MLARLLFAGALAVGVVAGAVATPGGAPEAAAEPAKKDPVAAKAAKDFRKRARAHLKFMRGPDGLGRALDNFCSLIDELAQGAAQGSVPADAAAAGAANAWLDFLADCDQVVEIVLGTGASDSDSIIVDSGLDYADPAHGLLPGQCGEWDKFESAVQSLLDKARAKAFKKLKKLQMAAAKAGGHVNVQVAQPPVPPAPPAGAPPAPAPPPKEFRMDAKASGATVDSPNSGILCAGGQADPAGGNMIQVKLFDASGTEVGTQTVNIDGRCRWRVCFPSAPPNNLPSGVYRVEAVQTTGGAGIAHTFSVPTTN